MALIRLQQISRRYQMGAETIHALREVSLEIAKGEITERPKGLGPIPLCVLVAEVRTLG